MIHWPSCQLAFGFNINWEWKKNRNEQARNFEKILPTLVFLQAVKVNLVSFAEQTKEMLKIFFFFFPENGNILFTKFPSFSAEIRASAATSTVSLMTLLLSVVIHNLQ